MLYSILFNETLTANEAVIHFLITILVYMVALSIHEFAHAFIAFRCGDSTAKNAGRMTLNPFKHIDLTGFLFFIFLGIGWAKPVPVNPLNYKKFKKGTRSVSIAGILANFIFGLVAAIIYAILLATVGFDGVTLSWIKVVLQYIMVINSILAMFNLLPVPTLDGFAFVASFAKTENKFLQFMAKNGFKVLIGILLVGMVTDLLFGFDIFTIYLSLMHDLIYVPVTWLGGL